VEFFERVPGGWQLKATWAGHNGDGGWVTLADRTAGDLKSPIGVYTLTDAGGKLPNPGTKLSYVQSASFVDYGKGFLGESLLDAFNYVIAINYNHEPGTSPESTYYPMGEAKGGGVWIHVDHGGPTHACISIPQDGVKTLLVELDPADDPVIVMGDRADLASD
jgi:L,D-peptidoglycan transpeptidase YkuD (ErfK/YbiS/YcfS/YnhG family)